MTKPNRMANHDYYCDDCSVSIEFCDIAGKKISCEKTLKLYEQAHAEFADETIQLALESVLKTIARGRL